MTSRVTRLPERPQPMSPRHALERVDTLLDDALDHLRAAATPDEVEDLILEAQAVACLSAARERRRERGE